MRTSIKAKRGINPKHPADAFKRTRADHQSELAEDYVELIADLIAEKGEARGNDVALRLGVANATVAKMLKRLSERGLITQEPYRPVALTDAGRAMAERGRERHAIVEQFLRALGVSAVTASLDSEGIEHHCSAETLAAMERFTRHTLATVDSSKKRAAGLD